MVDARPWRQAWAEALYGDGGFYRRPEGPAGHFRTAGHAAPDLLAAALGRLAAQAGCTAVVDVGAGRGELLRALAPAADGLRLHGVDVVDRPAQLPPGIGWSRGLGELPDAVLDGALVVCWELLDVVPATVVEVDAGGVAREVHVHPGSGLEVLGPPVSGRDAEWLRRWWPLEGAAPGRRAEAGGDRDALWSGLVRRVRGTPRGGLLLAVDYAHELAARPPHGSLAGFRAGRQVPPVPDGSCDVTAHVALDAVAAAGRPHGSAAAAVTDQARALRALGVGAAPVPVGGSGAQVLAALARRSQAGELLDPGGLGGFGWLLQPAGRPLPSW